MLKKLQFIEPIRSAKQTKIMKRVNRYASVPSFASCAEFQHSRQRISRSARYNITNSQKQQCFVCGIECDTLEIDHVQPLRFYGTNDVTNLHAICPNCHASKSNLENRMFSDHCHEQKTKKSKYWMPESIFYFFKT